MADVRAQHAPIVAFANDWQTDPTSKHHLMRLLAEQRDLLWVEASGMRRPTAASSADWKRIAGKVKKMFGGTRPGAPGMTVLSPPGIPLPGSPTARALNARLYRGAVLKALRGMGRREIPVLWVYTPTVARYLDVLPAKGLIYHCVDRWWEFAEYDAEEMRRCHEILCRRANHVFASSLELKGDCVGLSDHVSYVPHGVEWEHFRHAVTQALPRPADLPAPGRPMVGFVGLIDHWVDTELLANIARQHPEADLVLIGASRVPMDTLTALPNVYVLGRKPFSELPAYLRAFDVALIPFMVNALTLAVNPIKLREYLSAGVPVVTTALPELLPFAGRTGIDVAGTTEEFLAAVTRRLTTPPTSDERLQLCETMRNESWPGRLAAMLHELGDLV